MLPDLTHLHELPYRLGGRDPATGVDCWGLVRLALRDGWGIEVEAYETGYASEAEAAELVDRERASWREVVGKARPGDLVLFRMGQARRHIGIVTMPGWFLHVSQGMRSRVDRLVDLPWNGLILGFYRHVDLH